MADSLLQLRSDVARRRRRSIAREIAVLGITAVLCATALAAAIFRDSIMRRVSMPTLFAARQTPHRPPAPPSAAGAGPLVKPSDLVYEGAFRLPTDTIDGTSFAYGGTSIAFNPARNSLFVVGHDWHQRVAEISIPDVRAASTVRGLATAAMLQPFSDVTDGRMGQVGPNTVKIGGILPYDNRLYVTAYLYYDGAGTQTLSHFVSTPDLSVDNDARGPFPVGTLGAGFVSGYFAMVPRAWRELLGGPVLNGNCCLGVISRTSYGPALFAIDPARVGGPVAAPATPLVYYPSQHPLEPGDTQSGMFNLTTEIRGVVFHEATRSVLFFGRHGTGPYCYGPGTADPARAGQPADGGVDRWCLDPAIESKGTHAYPYSYYVWAYDANDLAAVKAGRKAPWDVHPYAAWPLTLPYSSSGSAVLNGAAYDPRSGRIFVSQGYGDGEWPIIHVFTIDTTRKEPS